jgi:NAD(P)-dependent dehydrogenase (short-subunit alcohol dehydrogenase family)
MTFDLGAIPSQRGRLAIVTGANTGLGYETTRDLAQTGMKVVMACRSEDRALRARARIEADVPGADLEFMHLDLGALSSVREFASAFRNGHERLDLLINNAGVMWIPYTKTADGFEGHMAANYFGHFLLTSLLLDVMPDGPSSRVVTLSSIAHRQPPKRIRFEDLNWERGYNKYQAYAQTKLACLLFAKELQRRLERSGRRMLSVAAHPGVSETELARTMKPWLRALVRYTVGPFVFHPPREAARSIVMAALAPDVAGGEYFGPQGRREMKGPPGRAEVAPWAQDEDAARRLWEVSEELTGARFALAPPGPPAR